jgi:cobaltochelatase CobN
MGRETRARYLNPKWIKEMLKEGYAGARFISKVIDYLWGWQVTVPEAVTTERWQQFYETYVLDKYNLHIKQQMLEAGNLFAYQSMLARMVEVIRKGYWRPSRQVLENLVREYAETVEKTGLTCCDHTCNNPLLARFINNVLISVPSFSNKATVLKKALKEITSKPQGGSPSVGKKNQAGKPSTMAPGKRLQKVQGYEMKELNKQEGFSSAPIPYLFIIGFILFILIVGLGYKRKN